MNKEKIKDAIKILRSGLIRNDEALSLISKLENIVDDINQSDSDIKQVNVSGTEAMYITMDSAIIETRSKVKLILQSDYTFPLPDEITGNKNSYALFSDGACRGNPGPGSWGVVGQDSFGNILFEGSQFVKLTTNNIMELEGAIKALELLSKYFQKKSIDKDVDIFLFSDSKYVTDGISKWVPNWKKKGWKKADKKAPENLELWKRLDQLKSEFTSLSFRWVKGHDGHPQNERCDKLANLALDNSGL